MKQKGFTLVELLGVIAILAIIGAIVVPIVTNVINKSMDDTNNAQVTAIEKAAKNWKANNMFNVDTSVSISTLKEQGYLENINITNPKTDQSYECSEVEITKTGDKFKFEFKYKECES